MFIAVCTVYRYRNVENVNMVLVLPLHHDYTL